MTDEFFKRLLTYEFANRKDLPRIKREWLGERVIVRYINARGHYHKRTSIRWAFGVLVKVERDDQVAVRDTKTGEVKSIHYTRVTTVYNQERKLKKEG